MRVSAKGQVTIPIALRKRMGIVRGSEVAFFEKGGCLHLEKVETTGRGAALVRRMTGKGQGVLSTDEILSLTRGNK